jgi:hypothetical protein
MKNRNIVPAAMCFSPETLAQKKPALASEPALL